MLFQKFKRDFLTFTSAHALAGDLVCLFFLFVGKEVRQKLTFNMSRQLNRLKNCSYK